jgi:hypothetical protein
LEDAHLQTVVSELDKNKEHIVEETQIEQNHSLYRVLDFPNQSLDERYVEFNCFEYKGNVSRNKIKHFMNSPRNEGTL